MDQDTLNKKIRLLKICVQLIKKYKLIKGVSVIHLMVYKQEQEIATVISNFK